MFARKIRVEYEADGRTIPCPLKWLDSFSMRQDFVCGKIRAYCGKSRKKRGIAGSFVTFSNRDNLLRNTGLLFSGT